MRWLVVVLALAVVFSIVGVPGLVTGGSLDWTLDPETGASWREMSQDELEAVGYPNQTGWITKDYGDLDAFKNFTEVTIDVAYDGDVVSVNFGPSDSVERVLDKVPVIPLGSAGGPVELNDQVVETLRYNGTRGWFLAQSNATDQLSAHTMYPGHTVWMWGPHPDLGIDPEDYIYTIRMGCGGGGGGPTLTGPSDGCPESGTELSVDVVDSPEPGAEVITFSMMAEVNWCESPAHRNDWQTDQENIFAEIEDSHLDTVVHPTLEWQVCWVMAAGFAYDHSEDHYVHDHADPQHPWAYNNVPADHGTAAGDDSYLDGKTVLDGQDQPNVYDHAGVLASEEHLAEHHNDDRYLDTDVTILVHQGTIAGAGGWAFQPGQRNVVNDETSRAATVEAQETGHNLDADHCEAYHRGDGEYTLMANPADPDCDQSDLSSYVNKFSEHNATRNNVDRVNDCVQGDRCFQ